MAALTTAPDTAAFGRGCFGGCGGCTGTVVSVGCTGCTGAVVPVGSCHGSCFGSCYGGGCYSSCHGGGLFGLRGRLGGLFGRSCHSSCHGSCYGAGCHSSCMGSSCTGSSCVGSSCFGSCHGACYGGFPVNPINPTTACYGSPLFYNSTGTVSPPTVYGWPVYSPTSAGYGSCFGSGPVYYGPDFHQPAFIIPPVSGSGVVEGGLGVAPTVTIDHAAARAKPSAAPARLTVELPAAAKLFVDGELVKGESASRNFHTPDLPGGKTFYYDLKAEVEVNGTTVTESKRVLVKAGDALSESFDKLIAAVKVEKTDVAKK